MRCENVGLFSIVHNAETCGTCRFLAFHEANPHVYDLLRRFALEAKRRGRYRFSIWAVYQRARWHTMIETTDTEWKLNNNWTPRYARLLMEQEPELREFFETRELKT